MTHSHASTLKKICGILPLGEEHAITRTNNNNAEKEVNIIEICHGKLTM
jgi:hypothetical protein